MSAYELRQAAATLREFWPNAPVESDIAAPLADWLEQEANIIERREWPRSRRSTDDAPLALARLINGGAS